MIIISLEDYMSKVESYLEIAVHEEVRIERNGKPYVRILPYTLPKSKADGEDSRWEIPNLEQLR